MLTAMITPMTADGALDTDGAARLAAVLLVQPLGQVGPQEGSGLRPAGRQDPGRLAQAGQYAAAVR